MALTKRITQENGAVTYYHMISAVTVVNGIKTVIEVDSYPSKASREAEKQELNNGNPSTSSCTAHFISIQYQDGMTLSKAYEYLLTTDDFSGATSDNE